MTMSLVKRFSNDNSNVFFEFVHGINLVIVGPSST
jgi:hypothetical protein